MAQSVQDIMTTDVLTVEAGSSVREAAQKMSAEGVGDVMVLRNEKLCGIVTDRDIAVRVVAENKNPAETAVADICSPNVVTLVPKSSLEDAVAIVREHALRRIPVVDGSRAVGIVSLGDLAMERDPSSALADVSAAAPNS